MSKYEKYVRAINHSPYMVALATTGGGQSFISEFVRYGGASATIVDYQFPYAKKALEKFCGKEITKFCSEDTARSMAIRSYLNCIESCDAQYAIGIGVSCSMATDNEREGRTHKFYVARHTKEQTITSFIELEQGMTREEEEQMLCDFIFVQILGACTDHRTTEMYAALILAPSELHNMPRTLIDAGGDKASTDMFYQGIGELAERTLVLAPGSYNPFHAGHDEMLTLAHEITGVKPILEITSFNADKGLLDFIEIKNRIGSVPVVNFVPKYLTVVTSARTFLDKAKQFAQPGRNIVFVVGVDTWNRVLDPKYAGEMDSLSGQLSAMDVKFLVFPRGEIEFLHDPYMDQLRIFDDRVYNHVNTLSSTEIRKGMV